MEMSKLEKLFFGCMALLMLDVSLLVMHIGRNLYGKDAILLWAMGFIGFMGVMGISNFLGDLIFKVDKQNGKTN